MHTFQRHIMPSNAPPTHAPPIDRLWDAITRDPLAGVTVLDATGEVTYANPQAAAIFLGPNTTPDHVIGKTLHAIFPQGYADERLNILQQVIERHEPRLLRAVWRGWQHFSWVVPFSTVIDADGDAEASNRVLTITRRQAGFESQALAERAESELHAVDVISLDGLSNLTRTELVVLALLGHGMTIAEAAEHLQRSERTIQSHRDAISRKLGLSRRSDLVTVVQRSGLTVADAYRRQVQVEPER